MSETESHLHASTDARPSGTESMMDATIPAADTSELRANASNDNSSAPVLASSLSAGIDVTAVRVVALVQAAMDLAAAGTRKEEEEDEANACADVDEYYANVPQPPPPAPPALEKEGESEAMQSQQAIGNEPAEQQIVTDSLPLSLPQTISPFRPQTANDVLSILPARRGGGTQQSFLPRHVSRRHSTAININNSRGAHHAAAAAASAVSAESPAAALAVDALDTNDEDEDRAPTIAPSSRATTARSTRQSSGRRMLARKPGTPMTVFTSAGLAFEVRPDRRAGAHDSLRAVLASNTHPPDAIPPKGPELPSIDSRPQPAWFRTRYAPRRVAATTAQSGGGGRASSPASSSSSPTTACSASAPWDADDVDGGGGGREPEHEYFSAYSMPLPLTRASSAPVAAVSSPTSASGFSIGMAIVAISEHQQRQQRRHRLLRALRARRDAELQEQYLGFPGVEAREFVAQRMNVVMMAAAAAADQLASAAVPTTTTTTRITTPPHPGYIIGGGGCGTIRGGLFHDAVSIAADAQALAPTVNTSHPCAQTFGQLGRIHWREADPAAPRCHSPQYYFAVKGRRRKEKQPQQQPPAGPPPSSPPTLRDLVPGLRKAPKVFPHQLKRVTQSKYVIPPMDG
ncbi:hypothetical protein HDU86_000488 [Geranomyces michiganensis]|nr:hypothetical protein HDU86_000488 [Geranomyces michiganensis]